MSIRSFNIGFIILYVLLSLDMCLANNSEEAIFLKDKSQTSGIDFVHYAPRPRWCEIGPYVVGAATNEGLSLVFEEEKEYSIDEIQKEAFLQVVLSNLDIKDGIDDSV